MIDLALFLIATAVVVYFGIGLLVAGVAIYQTKTGRFVINALGIITLAIAVRVFGITI